MSDAPMSNEEIQSEIDAARLEKRYRLMVARQSRIRAAIERLQTEAGFYGTDSFDIGYSDGIKYAVSAILAAIEEEVSNGD